MSTHPDEARLNGYADGSLDAAARVAVEAHLASCAACRAEAAALAALLGAARALPRSIAPDRDLWGGIEARITAGSQERGAGRSVMRWLPLPLAALLVLGLGMIWWTARRSMGWEYSVARGRVTVDGAPAPSSGRLRPGRWIETGAGDSVRFRVGDIGMVALSPGSRARVVSAGGGEHRLMLARGAVYAEITAAPRRFVVETPAAVATDLGCAYALTVDSLGAGLLHVTAGWVELARDSDLVTVPYDAYAPIDPRRGPGTPYVAGAPPVLRDALAAFDAGTGGEAALGEVLAAARPEDAVSLMNLLTRTAGATRVAVYERLVVLAPPPAGVERAAVLALDTRAVNRWWDAIRPPRLERDAGALIKKKKRMRLIPPRAGS